MSVYKFILDDSGVAEPLFANGHNKHYTTPGQNLVWEGIMVIELKTYPNA